MQLDPRLRLWLYGPPRLDTALQTMPFSSPLEHYCGQRLCLSSQHRKEQALARPFRAGLGMILVTAGGLDTDRFGSFCGAQPRLTDAQQSCRQKTEAGMELSGLTLGLGSEGSFGPHPALPWLAVGIEWLTFMDRETSLVIQESQISTRTNFSHLETSPGAAIDSWLQQIGFPSHAVLVRPQQPPGLGVAAVVAKGLQRRDLLDQAIREAAARSADGMALLETDMRAHVNPTRMRAIRQLGIQLVRRLRCPCPACGAPGWGLIERLPGLPCRWCGQPTERVALEIFGCAACEHQQQRPRPDGLLAADPEHCLNCNP